MRLPTEPAPAATGTLQWGNFVVTNPAGRTEVHTVPYHDIEAHQLWEMCGCRPRGDCESSSLWVHNSFDGRERYQEGGAAMH